MSQSVGVNFKSKIPTLGDDASIVEALRVYHYGVDLYSGQPIPTDSIEGNFTSLNNRVTTLETTVTGLGSGFVKLISETGSPNVITGQSTTTVPLTIRAIASQTSALQNWQNSSNTNVATLSTAGSFATAGYISIGSTTLSSTIANSINIINAVHKGITIKAATSQTANLQEWQNNSSTILSVIGPTGSFATSGYVSSGSSTLSSTVAVAATIINAAHKGITVRSATSQTGNLQEWQNSSGTAVSWVTAEGKIYVRGTDIESIVTPETFNPLMLIGA